MSLVKVIDIETGGEESREIPTITEFDTVYRNGTTRNLDSQYGRLLQPERDFVPPELARKIKGVWEKTYLKPFVRHANSAGFFFGFMLGIVDMRLVASLKSCEENGSVEMLERQGGVLVFPKELK